MSVGSHACRQAYLCSLGDGPPRRAVGRAQVTLAVLDSCSREKPAGPISEGVAIGGPKFKWPGHSRQGEGQGRPSDL